MMNLPNTEPQHDRETLNALQDSLLKLAVELFGPRDLSFLILPPQFTPDGPQTRFTEPPVGVYAELSENARVWWRAAVYELAHESVHLLDPVTRGNANYLEEGVAVFFSKIAEALYGFPAQPTKPWSYEYAIKLVSGLPGGVPHAAKHIRQTLGKFSAVTPEGLMLIFDKVDAQLAHDLTQKFDRSLQPE